MRLDRPFRRIAVIDLREVKLFPKGGQWALDIFQDICRPLLHLFRGTRLRIVR